MAVITVTEAAAKRVRELLEKDDKLATHSLRMKVVGGGCSGLRYELAFDDRLNEADSVPRTDRRAAHVQESAPGVPCANRL